jgi:MFS family permease
MGSSVCFLAFGLSTSFSHAVIARATAGLLNGNTGLMKSYIGRVTDATNQAKGFTFLSIAWGMGTCIAPIVGGVLCRPADSWPKTFEGTIFDDRPFLLPCGVAATWGFCASLLLIVFLDEPSVSDGVDQAGTTSYSKVALSTVEMVSSVEAEAPLRTSRFKTLLESRKNLVSNFNQGSLSSKYQTVRNPLVVRDKKSRYIKNQLVESDEIGRSRKVAIVVLDEIEEIGAQSSPEDDDAQLSNEEMASSLSTNSFSLQKGNVLIACSTYGLLAVAQQMIDEALPLFMKLSLKEGGLGFNESDIGGHLAVGGIATLVMSLFLVPKLEREYGAINIYRYSVLAATPLFTFFWLTASIWEHLNYVGGWIVISVLVFAKNTFLSIGFAGAFVMVNNCAPKRHLGSVNGVGQTMASFARTAGPALCGVFWSLGTQLHFVPLAFIAVGIASCLCVYLSFRLPSSLRYRFGQLPTSPSKNSQFEHAHIASLE